MDGRFANEWVSVSVLINLMLLTDLVLHVLCYGWRAILALRKDYLWEGML